MLRLVLVDDHPVLREGLKKIIDPQRDMTIAGEASDGIEAIRVIKTTPCEAVVLDISLPYRSGIEVLKEVHGALPRLPVLILSVHPEDHYGIRALRAGAAGYLPKDAAPLNLVRAIRTIIRGGKYFSAVLKDKILDTLTCKNLGVNHQRLSDREYQTLCMIGAGQTVTDIATELSLSVKTVSTYRTRVLEKLQLKKNAELIRYAIKEGLVP